MFHVWLSSRLPGRLGGSVAFCRGAPTIVFKGRHAKIPPMAKHLRETTMKMKLALICAAVALTAAACATEGSSTTSSGKDPACAGKSGGGESGAPDADINDEDSYLKLVDEYKSGKRQGEAYVPMHDVVAGWQRWEVTKTIQGKKVVEKWTVAKVLTRQFTAFVERDMGYYHLGYEVDLKVPRAEQALKGNVRRAFIGREGWEPREISVGKPSSNGKNYAGARAEDFEGLTMHKREFYGTCYTWTEGAIEIREWVAGNGWFEKVIKRTENGAVTAELTGINGETKGRLDWKW